MIEDTQNNKFGYYLSSIITEIDTEIYDEHAFLFTLKNNGRVKQGNGMMKFEYTKNDWAHLVYSKTDDVLIGIGTGHDLCLRKSNTKSDSFYQQFDDDYFDYHGTQNVILGRNGSNSFTPKRIIVIQMK